MEYVNVLEMASAREKRKETQLYLLSKYNLPLLSFTLNIPGAEKDNNLFRKIHKEGILRIMEEFEKTIIKQLIKNYRTGPEAYFVIHDSIEKIKMITIAIEESHPLGRIFDIDVIDTTGNSISRREIDLDPRKCLICNDLASNCSRSRKHTVEELLFKINAIADYLNN